MKCIKQTLVQCRNVLFHSYLCLSFGREMEEKVTLLNAPTKRPRYAQETLEK